MCVKVLCIVSDKTGIERIAAIDSNNNKQDIHIYFHVIIKAKLEKVFHKKQYKVKGTKLTSF